MARGGGLTKWFGSENWVDIGAPKKGGKFQNAGGHLRKIAKESILSVYLLLKQQR